MTPSQMNAPIYELTVTLRESTPRIWRRLLVPSTITLSDLHTVLQRTMGWTNSHRHEFEAGGVRYGTNDPEDDTQRMSERRTTLDQVLRQPQEILRYEYDFGDSWEHDVVLERILPPDPVHLYPLVTAGARACPPEDVGGIGGYKDLLDALPDPHRPEQEDTAAGIGRAFDPDAFDLREVNRLLHGGRRRRA